MFSIDYNCSDTDFQIFILKIYSEKFSVMIRLRNGSNVRSGSGLGECVDIGAPFEPFNDCAKRDCRAGSCMQAVEKIRQNLKVY